ncbi:F-box-like protein [Ceratobasidium sp. AG-Ba]|nr:F-box-like protein [Ceratobasidium sp. AG-Ba]
MNVSVESRTDAERHNSLQRINRLPIELLSRVFLAGDDLDYAPGLPEVAFLNEEMFDVTAFYFQEIVVQVCRHWRAVGLSVPKLWSHISTDQYPLDPRAELFLSRSGTTTPLYLSLYMTEDFTKGLENDDSCSHANRTHKLLASIVEKGGITSRWRYLKVWCDMPSVVIAVADFIAKAPLENLAVLLLDNNPRYPSRMYDCILDTMLARDEQDNIMFRSPPPKLQDLLLGGMPTQFFFNDPPTALVSNLTRLELGVTCTLPPVLGLYELLSSNTKLESLVLDMSLVDQVHLHIRPRSEVQVELPSLRRFALKEPKSANWAISVLAMINAPGVEEFTLDLNHTMPPNPPGAVARFVAIARQGTQLLKGWPASDMNMDGWGPIFPALRYLILGPFPDRGPILSSTIRAFTNLTRLDWELEESCEQAILDLAVAPLPCPQLEHLRVHGVPNDELVLVVKGRAERGAPLKTVEVNSRDWGMITDEAKSYLEDALETFGEYIDENESDSDSDDDWTDTDDEDASDGSTLDSSEGEIQQLGSQAAQHNKTLWINRLPVELLSRIFLTGDKLDEIDALESSSREKQQEFQEIVAQVCHHWRTVVTSIPMLWSYIRIDVSYPYSRAELFLARSGNTIPLELELDMTGEFMKGLDKHDNHSHAARTTESLAFIVSKGGATSRWASLKVWGGLPGVLFATIDFITGANLDNLHTLGLVNDPDDPGLLQDLVSKALLERGTPQLALFHNPPPLLRHVELFGIASDFLFSNPTPPRLCNLSHLELSTIPTLPRLESLEELLSNNLGLESLVLDMGLVHDLEASRLRSLRRFVLKEPMNTSWALFVLMMIDAPGLEMFVLDLRDTVLPRLPGAIATYAGIGRKNGQLLARILSESEANELGPIYPVLKHLVIGAFPDDSDYIHHMVRQYSSISRLDWELRGSAGKAFRGLGKSPLPCPRLEHRRVREVPSHELVHVVQSRAAQGKPIKILEVHSQDWGSIDERMRNLLYASLERLGQYDGESDTESETDTSSDSDTASDSDDGSTEDSEESAEGNEDDDWVDTDEESDSDSQ